MKTAKSLIRIAAILLSLLLAAVFFVFTSISGSVRSEYDTAEAGWNWLFRNGEIRFQLQGNSKIEKLNEGTNDGTIVSPTEGYFALGYGRFSTYLTYRKENGEKRELRVSTDKFNSWNRVLYYEEKDGSFSRYDNGIKTDITHIETIANQS